ncbi:cell division protein FtsX [Algirhabdus cladophorae]|uniref:cell division protein FtsX n=1 Tax=Algirhabdus cladophorae TaxID=3377108 RepID=UPI003B847DE5
MKSYLAQKTAPLRHWISGNPQADVVVPAKGYSAYLTIGSAAAMAFLAVFVLALSVTTSRLADRWSQQLAQSATLRISAPVGQVDLQVAAALRVLETTSGVASARALTDAEQRALLSPWFGADLPLEDLPIPRLIEIDQTADGFDAQGLRLRLSAEAPGAVLDDHGRWREPLVRAASRLRMVAVLSILLIAATTAAMITLAANAALAANAQVIAVLRLVGATDRFIADAFVRRFTQRTFLGAAIGAIIGLLGVVIIPSGDASGFLSGLGFQGVQWVWPFLLPVIGAIVAFIATKFASRRMLEEQS